MTNHKAKCAKSKVHKAFVEACRGRYWTLVVPYDSEKVREICEGVEKFDKLSRRYNITAD